MQQTMFAQETLNPNLSSAGINIGTRRTSRYLPVEQLRDNIKGMFESFVEYRDYVIKHDLQKQGYPLNIRSAYGYEYKIDEFLGNPEGTYNQWQSKRTKQHKPWVIGTAVRQQQIKRQKHEELQEELRAYEEAKMIAGLKKNISEQTSQQNSQQISENSISIDDVCKYLLSRDMPNVVLNIMNEGKITLQDARVISNHIFQYYETKQKSLVK